MLHDTCVVLRSMTAQSAVATTDDDIIQGVKNFGFVGLLQHCLSHRILLPFTALHRLSSWFCCVSIACSACLHRYMRV